MAHQRAATACGETPDDHADIALAGFFGVEGFAAPFKHLVVILMSAIGRRCQKCLESVKYISALNLDLASPIWLYQIGLEWFHFFGQVCGSAKMHLGWV